MRISFCLLYTSVLGDVTFEQEDIKKDPLLVTPIGICLNYYEQRNNFIMVRFNGERIKLYDNNRLTTVSYTHLDVYKRQIVHYSATEESDRQLKPESLLLVDSGGHYLEGTTDITRTFALGPVTDEMKDMFTRVCRSNMNLANAKFKEGCSGLNFDILAREPLWEIGMDYNHGTGHGVG